MNSFTRNVIKWGGLGLSALLTLNMFLRLFGLTLLGSLLAGMALTLYEFGALGWNRLLHAEARHAQRDVARICQWFCVITSILSSGAEITMVATLWQPPFDVRFMTLLMIVSALAVNIIGIVLYEQREPIREEQHKELDRQAKNQKVMQSQQDRIIELSHSRLQAKVSEIAGDVADELADEMRNSVKGYLSHVRKNINETPAPATPASSPKPVSANGNGKRDLAPKGLS